MKDLPACETDIKSGFLCTNCQRKLDAGDLTQFEIDLARDLIGLEHSDAEKYGYLKEVSFHKAIDYEDVVIVVVGKKDKLRFTEELIDWIKKSYEIEKIILVEKTNKPRPVVESLIAPGKLVSLNEIFLATGDIEFKAVIRKSDKKTILFTSKELEELIFELTGKTTRVEFI
jgi:transcription antitermination factor NusA-like protein